MNTEKATASGFRLVDVSGKTIRVLSKEAAKGISQITLSEFEKLAAGVYNHTP